MALFAAAGVRAWTAMAVCSLAVFSLLLAGGCSDEAKQFSEGPNAQLVVNPTSITFSPTPVGEIARQRVQLTNEGTDTLNLPTDNYVLEPATAPFVFPDYATVDGETVTKIAPGVVAELEIVYVPENELPASATLTLGSTNGGSETITITTTTPVAQLLVNPNPVVFGAPTEGVTEDIEVIVSNEGTADLVIDDAFYRAVNTTDFELVQGLETASGPVTLEPKAQVSMTMRYTPTGDPTQQDLGELVFVSNTAGSSSGQTVVEVKAPSEAPRLELIPGRVDFGPLDAGTSATSQVIATNVGDAALNVSEVSFSLDSSADFGYLGDTGSPVSPVDSAFTLEPGESKTLEVTYAPSDGGLDTGYLYVYSNDPLYPAVNVVLTGSQAGPEIIVQPPMLNFGQVGITASKSLSFTIINDGTRDLEVSDLVPVDFPADLTFVADGVTGSSFTIPSRGQQRVTVTYTPTVATPLSMATLEVLSNDPDEPQVDVAISFEGVEGGACTIVLEPSTLNFGLVPGGQTKVSPLAVRNTGALPCRVNNVNFQTSTLLFGNNPFGLANPPFAAQTLQPSSDMLVNVVYAPFSGSDTEDFVGQAIFDITDPATGDAVACESPLPTDQAALIFEFISGGGQSSCFFTFFSFGGLGGGSLATPDCWACLKGKTGDPALAAIPSAVEFGLTTLGCRSQTTDLDVYNRGSAFTDINDIYMDPSCSDPSAGPFFLYGVPQLPMQLNAGASIPLQVVYIPDGVQEDSCRIIVDGATETLTIPLSGEGTTTSDVVDTFEQVPGRKVDVLFVIDNSGSMGEEQSNLASNFSSFINTATTWGVDFQLGATTTDTGDEGKLREDGGYRVLTPSTPNLSNVFGNIARVGTNGSSNERGLVAAYNALSDPNITTNVPGACPGGCATPYTCDNPSGACGGYNASFLREDASLEIVFVSDEDDFSSSATDFYVDFFKSIKGYRNDALMHAHAIVGSTDACNPSNRYTDAANRTGGVTGSLCNNFATTLAAIGTNAFGLRQEFFLSRVPEEATLVVTIDGVTANRGSDWSYDPNSNSIFFNSAPLENAVIVATYIAACFDPNQMP